MAVSWIEKSSDDELADYLPQLVQVQLKIPAALHIDCKPLCRPPTVSQSSLQTQLPPPPTLTLFAVFPGSEVRVSPEELPRHVPAVQSAGQHQHRPLPLLVSDSRRNRKQLFVTSSMRPQTACRVVAAGC